MAFPEPKFKKGDLVRYDVTGKMEGKCAMGVLACGSGVKELKLSEDNMEINDYSDILEAYGIEKEDVYPRFDDNYNDDERDVWDWRGNSSISAIIVKLNDNWNFSLKEIGEFLEVTFDL